MPDTAALMSVPAGDLASLVLPASTELVATGEAAAGVVPLIAAAAPGVPNIPRCTKAQ